MEQNIKKYWAWIPAVLIAIIIFILSNQTADESTISSENFSQILLNFANELKMVDLKSMNLKQMYLSLGTPVRKSAHVFEFGVLNISVLYGLYHNNFRGKKWLLTAFILTVIYACTDEFHQLFVPGRAGLITDVLIDSIGAMLVTFVFYIYLKVRNFIHIKTQKAG